MKAQNVFFPLAVAATLLASAAFADEAADTLKTEKDRIS